MSELMEIKLDSNVSDFYAVYYHNEKLVGKIAVHTEILTRYIKLLSMLPIKGKKLELFLSMDPVKKAGFMSTYLMKCARMWNIPQVYIASYADAKKRWKFCSKHYKDDSEYSDKVAESNYDLYSENIKLCDAIFEVYDVSINKARERKLRRILEE